MFERIALCLLSVLALFITTQRADAQFREPFRGDQRGVVKTVEATSITVAVGGGRETPAVEKTFTLAKNVEVCVGGFQFGGLFKEIKLADIPPGTTVGLGLSADQKTVESIIAEEPMVRGILKGIDAKKGTVTVATFMGREEGGESATYQIAGDAEIGLDDGRGRRTSVKEAKLDELGEGANVMVRLSLDKKQVRAIFTEGAMVVGVVKTVDAKKRLVTVIIRPARGDEAGEERTLAIAKDATVLTDDGKGRRLSLKQAKLDDVPIGAMVMAKLSVDQSFVMMLRAEGPAMMGMLKAIDADKRTITIAIPRGRNDVEEKTLSVAKDARVTFDGKETKLGDLKPGENGPFVQVRLTLNQQAVQAVMAQTPRMRE
ncbi:MAG: hypothetical protein HYR84_02800 [Planctomycetes bacterium]|nr:hypothetical protein [Planctomycetota bacterium]